MRRQGLAAVLGVLLLASPISAKSDVHRCAAKIGKAYAKMFDTVIAVGGEACVAGLSGNPAPLDEAALAKAVDKFNAVLQPANDRYGEANCWRTPADPVLLENAIDLAQSQADEFCLVEP